jgi:hypothetical protein
MEIPLKADTSHNKNQILFFVTLATFMNLIEQ